MNNIKYLSLNNKLIKYSKTKTNNKIKKTDNIFEKIHMNYLFYINYNKILVNKNKQINPLINLGMILLNKYEVGGKIFLDICKNIKISKLKR